MMGFWFWLFVALAMLVWAGYKSVCKLLGDRYGCWMTPIVLWVLTVLAFIQCDKYVNH